MDFDEIMLETEEKMEKALNHTLHEFSTLHTGKATPAMIESLQVPVEAYGTSMALRELAAITTPDSRTLSVQPWDKNTAKAIEKAIRNANLGFNPVARGNTVIIPVPELSGDRRRDLTKICSAHAEDGRVSIRQARHDAMDGIKKIKADGHESEDNIKIFEKEVQALTDKYVERINEAYQAKEKELLQV